MQAGYSAVVSWVRQMRRMQLEPGWPPWLLKPQRPPMPARGGAELGAVGPRPESRPHGVPLAPASPVWQSVFESTCVERASVLIVSLCFGVLWTEPKPAKNRC